MMRLLSCLFLPALALLPSAGAQEERRLLFQDLESEHFTIATAPKGLEVVAEELHAVWKRKLGQASDPSGKLPARVHLDREEFRKDAPKGASWFVKGGTLNVMYETHLISHFSAGGARLYLESAYPQLAARKDLPPWLLAGICEYFAGVQWKNGKLEFDSLQTPEATMRLQSFQSIVKGSEGWAFESAFKSSGSDFEKRRRVVEDEAWASFYFLFNAPDEGGGQGKNGALVPPFLAALNSGQKMEDAVAAIFKPALGGGYAALEKGVKEYFAKFSVNLKDREEEDWLIGETNHYTIYIQKGARNVKNKMTDKEILKDMKFKMELIFQKYSLAFQFQGRLSQRPQMRMYKGRMEYLKSGAPGGSAAYYDPSTKELVGYEDSAEDGIVFQIFCHEGCHQFFDLAFPGFYESPEIPMWFSEGLADCFGSSYINGKELYIFSLSGAAARRIPVVKSVVGQPKLPLSMQDLVKLNQPTFMNNADLCYPQSWSFVHFLWNYPSLDEGTGKYKDVVKKLIAGFKTGGTRDAVYAEAFQLKGKPLKMDDLEREWRDYVKTLKARN